MDPIRGITFHDNSLSYLYITEKCGIISLKYDLCHEGAAMFEKANAYVKQVKQSGYVHHRYDQEQNPASLFLIPRESFEKLLADGVTVPDLLLRYADVLGPNRLRGMKNAAICSMVSLSRAAITRGVEYELSLCLSDFYINEIESCRSEKAVVSVVQEILRHYYFLSNEKKKPEYYSYHVSNAIVFIRQNIYNKLTVEEIAENEGLEKHYFSTLFKKETGIRPSAFILKEKLRISEDMLKDKDTRISEIAASLSFSSSSHYCRSFKEEFGMTPQEYRKEYFSRFF